MDRALITELEKLIGKDAVVSDTTRLLSYESDALAMYSAPAELVLLLLGVFLGGSLARPGQAPSGG